MRSPVRHLGTERAAEILAAMRAELEDKVDILTGTAVHRILTTGAVEEDGVDAGLGNVSLVWVAPFRAGQAGERLRHPE